MEKVGGYRLVRKLGEGLRAEVWLGHAGIADERMAAVKVYRPNTTLESIDVEIEALSRCAFSHLLSIVDVATAPDGLPCLILPRLSGPSLARLAADRSSWRPGEIVTAIAPLVDAVAELHRAGIAHGGIGAPAVLLDSRGAPVLCRFGAAQIVTPTPGSGGLTPAQRSAEPLFDADLDRLAAMVLTLATRSSDDRAVAPLLDWLESAARDDSSLASLGDLLFSCAEPEPIDSSPRKTVAPHGSAASMRPVIAVGVASTHDTPPGSGPISALRGLVEGWIARATTHLRSVRKSVRIVGALGCVAIIGAVVIAAAAGRGGSGVHEPHGVHTAHATQHTAQPGSTVPKKTGPKTTGPKKTVPKKTVPKTDPAVGADDPVAAARALLTGRANCITARSTACLNSVEQADSAALEADRYFLRQLQGGGTVKDRRFDVDHAALIERLGDSAIIGLPGDTATPQAQQATALIVKADGKWMIRDLTPAG